MDAPTRSNLLAVRAKARLARKGHGLLKRKQDVLIREFFERVTAYRAYRSDVEGELREAYRALALDVALSGVFVSRSVSYATRDVFDIALDEQNLMGVRIPEIGIERRGASRTVYEASPLLAEAARRFRDLFERLTKLASMELVIERLADEITRTKRRVNSLEHIQIPRLEERARTIKFLLEEEEREAFVRLKMVKARLVEGE